MVTRYSRMSVDSAKWVYRFELIWASKWEYIERAICERNISVVREWVMERIIRQQKRKTFNISRANTITVVNLNSDFSVCTQSHATSAPWLHWFSSWWKSRELCMNRNRPHGCPHLEERLYRTHPLHDIGWRQGPRVCFKKKIRLVPTRKKEKKKALARCDCCRDQY